MASKRQTSFRDPKVTRNNFRVKDQGTVPYPKVERVANGGPPKPGMGKGNPKVVVLLFVGPNLRASFK